MDKVDTDTNPFRYCAEYYDKETDTIYLRARYYQPTTGRFLTEDSIKCVSLEMPNGQEIVDPISLNLYTYAHITLLSIWIQRVILPK